MFDYKVASENGSMYNTPPCWTIYMCGLVFKYLLKNGGLAGALASHILHDGRHCVPHMMDATVCHT